MAFATQLLLLLFRECCSRCRDISMNWSWGQKVKSHPLFRLGMGTGVALHVDTTAHYLIIIEFGCRSVSSFASFLFYWIAYVMTPRMCISHTSFFCLASVHPKQYAYRSQISYLAVDLVLATAEWFSSWAACCSYLFKLTVGSSEE